MHKRNRLFIQIALIYGLLGGLVALARLVEPGLIPGNAAGVHGHIMLLGLVLMFIYGIGLHMLPRFSGVPLYSERMANGQIWLANAGLPLMIGGWLMSLAWLVTIGGTITYAAVLLFAANVVFTVRPRRPGA